LERNNGIGVKNPSEVYILYDKIINNSLKYNDCENIYGVYKSIVDMFL